MADPSTLPNRLRPFKRINNDDAIPGGPPSGKGVPCGCHTPREFPNLEAEFRQFLRDRPGVLGKVAQAIETAKEFARTVAQGLAVANSLAIAAAAALATFPALAGGPLGPVILALGTVINAVRVAVDFVNGVVNLIDAGLNSFMARIGAALARRAIRRIPQWAPVEDAANKERITAAQIREVEGIVARSYCDPVGTPFYQWQKWLGWSIQIRPEERYRNLVVPGFAFAADGLEGGESGLVDPATVEVQWDTGALRVGGDEPGVFERDLNDRSTESELFVREPPFFDSEKAPLAAENNWLWPTAGMFAWASGRWVYDCSRPDSLSEASPNMYAMLNPARAMATATWEAFAFKENIAGTGSRLRNRVPAIRFMFIASRHGGHLDHPSLAEKDYEFILDLPPMPVPVSPFPIGHTHAHKRDDGLPDFPQNTIVLRPKLLRDLARPTAPSPTTVKLVTPVIELLPEADGAIRQVKVTVKATDLDLTSTGAGHAGFLLSLGWFDPNKTEAEKVKNCTVEFTAVRGRLQQDRDTPVKTLRRLFQKELEAVKAEIKKRIDTDLQISIIPGNPTSIDGLINNNLTPPPLQEAVAAIGRMFRELAHQIVDIVFDKVLELLGGAVSTFTTEEWMMHFGVNGRWRTRYLDLEKRTQAFSSPVTVEVPLGEDDVLFQSVGGVEWNPVGNIMFTGKNKRLLKRRNEAVVWSQIAQATGNELRDLMFEYALQILIGGEGQALALGIENDPLGIKQPGALDVPDGKNPMRMKDTPAGPATFDTSPARFAHSVGLEEVRAVETAQDDYTLSGSVNVAKQLPK